LHGLWEYSLARIAKLAYNGFVPKSYYAGTIIGPLDWAPLAVVCRHPLVLYMDIDQTRKREKTPAGHRRMSCAGFGCLTVVCTILGLSAATNFFFSARSDPLDQLSGLEKARISEVFHLRRAMGDSIWPGWSGATIPVIVYNEAYAFLIGTDNPAPGWRTVPQNLSRGGPWESVPNGSIDGRKYFRQRLAAHEHASPQAFTVRIGELWVASMTAKDWMPIKLGNDIRDGVPSVIRAFVPYRLIARLFLGLGMNTDGYICAIEHESFHAYQGIVAAGRLARSETILIDHGRMYPWAKSRFNDEWKAELNALADSLEATHEARMVSLAGKFMALRQARRKTSHIASALTDLERLREWEEGLAKYTELAIWKCASANAAYKPLPALRGDRNFYFYRGFSEKWVQELATLRRQSGQEDNLFYYTGMAQAFLLDRLNPEWKAKILQEGVFLEDLLSEALAKWKE
jgi:hypothetical protein